MPPQTPAPKVIHLETLFGDLDPRTGRRAKPSETHIYGLRPQRAEQHRTKPPAPDTTRRTHTK